jgi:hypothetical protein
MDREVTVEPNGIISVHFEDQSPMGRRSVHEIQENPHFGLEILGKVLRSLPRYVFRKPHSKLYSALSQLTGTMMSLIS